ncbi:Outer membrane efflux protein [Burkholderia sp. YR290]|nr:Outer membrane efflux protein [Burkholderia sp. YR290]
MPIFEGGRLKGTLQLREAQQQEAAIVYKHTVLSAWREVDDSPVVYAAEQRRRDQLTAVVTLNQRALSIAQQRYKAGALDYLDVLNVQRQLLEGQSNLEAEQGDGCGESHHAVQGARRRLGIDVRQSASFALRHHGMRAGPRKGTTAFTLTDRRRRPLPVARNRRAHSLARAGRAVQDRS